LSTELVQKQLNSHISQIRLEFAVNAMVAETKKKNMHTGLVFIQRDGYTARKKGARQERERERVRVRA